MLTSRCCRRLCHGAPLRGRAPLDLSALHRIPRAAAAAACERRPPKRCWERRGPRCRLQRRRRRRRWPVSDTARPRAPLCLAPRCAGPAPAGAAPAPAPPRSPPGRHLRPLPPRRGLRGWGRGRGARRRPPFSLQ